jgi:hypothetical protein
MSKIADKYNVLSGADGVRDDLKYILNDMVQINITQVTYAVGYLDRVKQKIIDTESFLVREKKFIYDKIKSDLDFDFESRIFL